MICAHCDKAFDPKMIGDGIATNDGAIAGDNFPIICPNCDDVLHVNERDYDILYGHKLACLNCANSFLLPERPSISSSSLFFKIGVLYLLILASLGLLYTPQSSDVITYLGQQSDVPRHLLWSFHDMWHDFLAFIRGLFI